MAIATVRPFYEASKPIERSIALLIATLSIAKVGCAYRPPIGDYPASLSTLATTIFYLNIGIATHQNRCRCLSIAPTKPC